MTYNPIYFVNMSCPLRCFVRSTLVIDIDYRLVNGEINGRSFFIPRGKPNIFSHQAHFFTFHGETEGVRSSFRICTIEGHKNLGAYFLAFPNKAYSVRGK